MRTEALARAPYFIDSTVLRENLPLPGSPHCKTFPTTQTMNERMQRRAHIHTNIRIHSLTHSRLIRCTSWIAAIVCFSAPGFAINYYFLHGISMSGSHSVTSPFPAAKYWLCSLCHYRYFGCAFTRSETRMNIATLGGNITLCGLEKAQQRRKCTNIHAAKKDIKKDEASTWTDEL